MIGILCALDAEVSKLYELIEDAAIEEAYGFRFAAGTLEGKKVVVAKCGVGKVNAAICAQTMIMKYAPELIINSGVSGSLSSELNICDIAVKFHAIIVHGVGKDKTIRGHADNRIFSADHGSNRKSYPNKDDVYQWEVCQRQVHFKSHLCKRCRIGVEEVYHSIIPIAYM